MIEKGYVSTIHIGKKESEKERKKPVLHFLCLHPTHDDNGITLPEVSRRTYSVVDRTWVIGLRTRPCTTVSVHFHLFGSNTGGCPYRVTLRTNFRSFSKSPIFFLNKSGSPIITCDLNGLIQSRSSP